MRGRRFSPGGSGVRAAPVPLPPPNMRAENPVTGHRPTGQLSDQPADRPAAAESRTHVTEAGGPEGGSSLSVPRPP